MAHNTPLNVTRSSMPDYDEYTRLIKPLWNTRHLTNNGSLHNELEIKINSCLKTKYTILYSNGHLALDCALRALELNGEVITTPFTFVSTVSAIVMSGLTPVFCDIKDSDFTIDETKIESLITPRTSAILPVHVYGIPCNVEAIDKIAKKYGLKVIYDAAHAFSVIIGGRGIGTFGDISMFSFHATKVFHTVEGGALTFNDEKLMKKLKALKNFGLTSADDAEYISLNAKMSEFHAAMGIANLQCLEYNFSKRAFVVKKYEDELSDIKGITLVNPSSKIITKNYAYLPIIINENKYGCTRDELYDILLKHNINSRRYFYPLVSDMTAFRQYGHSNATPIAKLVSNRVLALPLYPELSADDVLRITNTIKNSAK